MTLSRALLLLGLLAATALAGAVLTLRLGVRRSSERLLAIVVLGHLFLLVPVYALGALSAFSFVSTTLGTLAIDVAVVVIVARDYSTARVVAELGQALRALAADLARLIAPPPLLVTVAGAAVFGVAGLTAWLTLTCYFAPSFRAYDAPWYHEPITALTIQQAGLHLPALPLRLFFVDANPRGSELLSAWLVLISGTRALIELPSIVGFAALWLGTYRLARVFGARRNRAVGWAAVVVLTPGLLAYAQSTYVDLQACAMLTAAACFALARPMSGGSALLAVVAACLAASMKLYALPPGGCLVVAALVRARHAEREIPFRSFAWASAVAMAAAGVALATPLRNAVVHGNPLYPFSTTVPFLGRALSGPLVTASRDFEMTPTWRDLLRLIFQPLAAYHTNFSHYVEVHVPIESAPAFNYGYAMPAFGVAMAVLAIVQLVWQAVREKISTGRRTDSRTASLASSRLMSVAVVLLAVAAFFSAFPITRLARYLGFVFACTGALAATALSSDSTRRAGNVVLGVAAGLQLMMVFRQDPRLLYSPAEIWDLAQMPRGERELAAAYGAFASAHAAQFRDRVLAAGTIVLFGDDVLEPGPLWNGSMSNRVEYLPGDGDPTDAADARGATLVACTLGSRRCTIMEQRTDAWAFVGELYPRILSGECLLFARCDGACPQQLGESP